ncbi:hypothetical protein Bca4012_100478 [Brassica carinata]|uniref:Uncharacterized protein n=2 Tax=Brassica TaxID=3705 RepID=A0A0D3CWD3_BRAOL|nr:unnamed protein product [Brassica napus]
MFLAEWVSQLLCRSFHTIGFCFVEFLLRLAAREASGCFLFGLSSSQRGRGWVRRRARLASKAYFLQNFGYRSCFVILQWSTVDMCAVLRG